MQYYFYSYNYPNMTVAQLLPTILLQIFSFPHLINENGSKRAEL